MFTSPKIYDLNVRTPAKRNQEMAGVQKMIRDSFNAPTVVNQRTTSSTMNPNPGTPAHAMSLKQQQQQRMYAMKSALVPPTPSVKNKEQKEQQEEQEQ